MKVFKFIMASVAIATLSSCVTVPLHDTNHPTSGKITSLTVTRDEPGEGVDLPPAYAVKIGDHVITLPATGGGIEELFPAGAYTINIWNDAANITVAGETATADYDNGLIGWFFTGTGDVNIEEDKDHSITIATRQITRQLTLELDVAGDARERITSIEASLSGVAGAINIATGNPEGAAVTVPLAFALEDGKYSATTRLLGVAGSAQTLTLTLHFADGNPSARTIISDLSGGLAAFNADRQTPLALAAILTVTPSEAGVTATIDNWTSGGGEIIAN
jgi:hypothetical protein